MTEDFSDFYQEHYTRLVASLSFAAPRRRDIEDVAQEAFARVCARWSRIRGGSNPPGYLYRVAFRLLFRRAPPQPTTVSTLSIDYEDSPITNVVVRNALELLPAKQRAVAVLCLYLELQPNEAAQIMRVRPSTARVHLHRARQTLAAALADDLDEVLTRREPG